MGAGMFFQGFALRSVTLVLARGFGASISTVELSVRGWGEAFPALRPSRDEEPPAQPPGSDLELALAAARATGQPSDPPSLQQIPWSGWITLAEVEDGQEWVVQHGPLYVIDAQEVKRSGDDAVSVLRLSLADLRFRTTSGALTRWSFNRRLGNGEFSRDAFHPENRPWTTAEILGAVVSDMRGRPPLRRTPVRLQVPAGPVSLAPFGPALGSFGDLVSRHGLEQPCLTWGGAIELWDPGEAGAGGDQIHGFHPDRLPPELCLWLQGQGKGHDLEHGWPADYVLVRGEPRVATAAVDNWIAVLSVPPELQSRLLAVPGYDLLREEPFPAHGYVPLDEDTLKKLVPGERPPGGHETWMGWLKVWILSDRTHQGVAQLSKAVAELLDQQAWRLWALPGALRSDGSPGRNAHLLPLLPRAEIAGDRRLPVTVEAFSFAPVHVEFRGTDVRDDRVRTARANLEAVQRAVRESLIRSGPSGAVNLGGPQDALLGPGALSPAATRDLLRSLFDKDTGISWDEVAVALNQWRYIQRLEAFNGDLARLHERALRELYRSEEGVREIVFEAAKAVVDLEKRLNETQLLIETGRNADTAALVDQPELAQLLRAQVLALSTQAKNVQEQLRLQARAGVNTRAPRPRTNRIFENLPREVDAGAQIVDPQRGVIRTSQLAGWLAEPRLTDPLDTEFLPRPVRAIFGAVVRPRVDLLPGERAPVETQRQLPPGSQEDYIPSALGDQETWFVRVFGRSPAGGEPQRVELPEVEEARRALLSRAQVVTAPLQELVPLPAPGGEPAPSNALELERDARDLAVGHLARRQVIRADRATFGRPHKVRLDGVVGRVTIRSRPRGAGFQTEIQTGSSEKLLERTDTIVRPRQGTRAQRDEIDRGGAAAK